MAPKDFTLSGCIELLKNSEGRDKLGLFVQYVCRVLQGSSQIAGAPKGSQLAELNQIATEMFKAVSGSRRVLRWGKELPVAKSLPTALKLSPVDCMLAVGARVGMLGFIIVDHLVWLRQVNILKSKRTPPEWIQLAFKFFTVFHFCNALTHAKKLLTQKSANEEERYKVKELMLASTLSTICTMHTSKLFETHDFVTGVCGMVSSSIAIKNLWPEVKK